MKATIVLIVFIIISSCGKNPLSRIGGDLKKISKIDSLETVKTFSFPSDISLENDSSELKIMLKDDKVGNECELKYEKVTLEQDEEKVISKELTLNYTENKNIIEERMVIERVFKNNEYGLDSLTCYLNLSNLYNTSGKDLELETLNSTDKIFY